MCGIDLLDTYHVVMTCVWLPLFYPSSILKSISKPSFQGSAAKYDLSLFTIAGFVVQFEHLRILIIKINM